jgi:hypothetical protein
VPFARSASQTASGQAFLLIVVSPSSRHRRNAPRSYKINRISKTVPTIPRPPPVPHLEYPRSEDAEELCSIGPATLLAGEQVIAAVLFAEPSAQRVHFVEERLASVWIEGLNSLKRALEPTNRD